MNVLIMFPGAVTSTQFMQPGSGACLSHAKAKRQQCEEGKLVLTQKQADL